MMRNSRKKGFSLIELLAAVTILMIIIIMMGMIFRETNRSWTIGIGRANNNTAGRAYLSQLKHDLQYMISDDMISFCAREDYGVRGSNSVSYGHTNSEICFASLVHDSSSGTNRAVREIFYFVRPMHNAYNIVVGHELARGYYDKEIEIDPKNHCYWKTNWYEDASLGGLGRPPNSQTVAENIAALSFWCPMVSPDNSTPLTKQYYTHWTHASATNGYGVMPLWVDLYVEVMNPDDARQASAMEYNGLPTETVQSFVEKKARRYTARVFLANRAGYTR